MVGDAIRAHTLKQGSRNQLVAIGIATWGCITNKEALIVGKQVKTKHWIRHFQRSLVSPAYTTHTLSLTFSHTHKHTHTQAHTHTLSLSLSLSLFISFACKPRIVGFLPCNSSRTSHRGHQNRLASTRPNHLIWDANSKQGAKGWVVCCCQLTPPSCSDSGFRASS